ncbi:unnamed protein product [Spirodela intermedia]|uniref:mannan endo-1,4-beta-mannosidase n=1 Tax=Spirodela intermedia TaxID=51605 RepID=A0A7I8IAA8_SPIIN|nr:unnamed protein product [Spirodela intermedia]CAA6654589.1 unnamed protein product [Spirodela intermedia]
MVERKGNTFMVGNEPFYMNGFNTYWLMILAVDQSTRGKVSEVLRQASSVGLTVCRTWAFNDGGWRALQKSPGVYDEEVFKALDFVVSEARKHKIRFILSLCNNWEGGAGLNLTSDDDFFSDPTVKGYFRSHVEAVLNRVNTVTNVTYKEDPTIFAWELMNEPRCPWIQEMAAHVKSIDPRHLLEIGSEGFYGPSSPDRQRLNPNSFAGQAGTDFLRNHRALGIDFASAHMYPDAWLPSTSSDGQLQFAAAWMQGHINDAEELGMPVVFAEFGVSANGGQLNQSFRDAFIEVVYETLLNSTRRGGSGAGCLLWQLFPEGVDYMDDGYAVVLPNRPPQRACSPASPGACRPSTPSVPGNAAGYAGRRTRIPRTGR